MKQKKVLFTKEGYEKMQKDYQDLTVRRKDAVLQLKTAREMGDLSENGAYKAARFELTSIDRELRRLVFLLQIGEIAGPADKNEVDFGSHLVVSDGKNLLEFTLVGGYESNPSQKKLSVNSPIGQAVLGKRKGEKAVVNAPGGQTVYTVVSIR